MRICYINRKPQTQYHSIEKIFCQIRQILLSAHDIDVIELPHSSLSFRSIFSNLRFVRQKYADLYHVTGDVHYVCLGVPRQKTILTIHDCVFMHRTKGIKRWILWLLYIKWPISHCQKVTTISEKSKEEIVKFAACSPEKITVVPNPVGSLLYRSNRAFNIDKPVLLFLGSTPNKNLPRVIEAIKGMSCHLSIIGKISDSTRELMSKYGISFEQKAGLTEQELADAYAQSDVVLFPSTYEGFGMPIIEGQQSGKPVITSNIRPMKDVAGEGACLVNPLDVLSIREGILRVISDQRFREDIVQKGFDNVKQYDPETVAQKYLHLYNEVMSP